MAILVNGGAGYIGSHTCIELMKAGYEIIVADNLYNSCEEALRRVEQISGKKVPFVNVDLCDGEAVDALFASHPEIERVTMVCFDRATLAVYQDALAEAGQADG